jgi:hypothetical protein
MLSVNIGGNDVTLIAENYTFSNVARGGFEQAQFQLSAAPDIRHGDEIIIFDGGDFAWHGFVNSPGEVAKDGKHRTGIVGLGFGAELKSGQTRMIFADADFNNWRGAPLGRVINALIPAGYYQNDFEVRRDVGLPCLTAIITGSWAVNIKPMVECWYDSEGIEIESLWWQYIIGNVINSSDTNWNYDFYISRDDQLFTSDGTSGNMRTSGVGTATGLTPSTSPTTSRYAIARFYYALDGVGSAGAKYELFWPSLVVYGNHGLTKRTMADTSKGYGFYPSDIVSWAIRTSGMACNRRIDTASSYIIGHLVYKTPTDYETIVADAAKFMGWIWGTWEPTSVFSSTPTFHFEKPPENATCEISLEDCEDVDEPVASLDRSYNSALVQYSDSAGAQYTTTVTIANPVLDAIGQDRVLPLSMGIADSAAAATYGRFALSLAQSSQRGGGSVSIAGNVDVSSAGGSKPATLIRAGRDRIRVPELNDGNVFVNDDRSLDTFLVERVETTVTNGRAVTRVEFDSGADLMEVINARMTAEMTAANVGG